MEKRSVMILGATGSIGDSTFKVLDANREKFEVKTLVSFGNNIEKLAKRSVLYQASTVAIFDQTKQGELEQRIDSFFTRSQEYKNTFKPKVVSGQEAVLEEIASAKHDICISAITGIAGLKPTLAAIPNCQTLALANKESIVCAGDLVLGLAQKNNTKIIPIDSEHNAIYKILLDSNGEINTTNISKIILTASGGPFWDFSLEQMKEVTPKMALKHPTWSMGAKISIDSATMMNKGLELIEAAKLFNLKVDQLGVLVHRQSIVHGIVEYQNGTTMLCASPNDMAIPIEGALLDKFDHLASSLHINLAQIHNLTFETEDAKRFPLLQLAREAYSAGCYVPIAMNAANEIAVEAFLLNKIKFLDISEIVFEITEQAFLGKNQAIHSVQDVLDYDQEARLKTLEIIKT